MDPETDTPLDISEFKCTAISTAGVVVVFEQTNRRYLFGWEQGQLGLAKPSIEGDCTPHAPEVIDCLARAVAHQAARSHPVPLARPAPPPRTIASHVRDLLFARG